MPDLRRRWGIRAAGDAVSRELKILAASVQRPDKRHGADPYITVGVISQDLKQRPVHMVPLTEDQALDLAFSLLQAIRNIR